MKRKIALTLLLLLLITVSTACKSSVADLTTNDAYAVTRENYPALFASKTPADIPQAVTDQRLIKIDMSMSNFQITDDQLSCDVSIKTENKSVDLKISGVLACGCRNQNDINSVIVEVPDQQEGFKVRLFEIFNDTSEKNPLLMCNDSLTGTRHIKLYLEDADGVIYLLETAMPDVLMDLNAGDYREADKYKDVLFCFRDLS